MTTKTEGAHAAEFLVSESNGALSRNKIVVLSGQDLVAGEIVLLSAGKAIAADGAADTAGDLLVQAAGILYDNVDATGGDEDGVLIDFGAEVSDAELTFPTETTAIGEHDLLVTSLGLLDIKVRT